MTLNAFVDETGSYINEERGQALLPNLELWRGPPEPFPTSNYSQFTVSLRFTLGTQLS